MGSERPSRTAAHELGAGLTVPAKSGRSSVFFEADRRPNLDTLRVCRCKACGLHGGAAPREGKVARVAPQSTPMPQRALFHLTEQRRPAAPLHQC